MDPRTAVIGGSNAFRFLDGRSGSLEPLGAVETPYGRTSPLFRFKSPTSGFYFIARHGAGGYEISAPFVNYRANIYALKDLGVDSVLAWSGPGSINEAFRPGDLVLPDDILDEQKSDTLLLLERINACQIDSESKEKLFNQALVELRDKMKLTIVNF